MRLGKFSMGIGDRFGRQGRAQLAAMVKARQSGLNVTPVWNKSHREHSIIGTAPADVRREADDAVRALAWDAAYHVDADHIGLPTVDAFIEASDFFTLDVADFSGRAAGEAQVAAFVERHAALIGEVEIPGLAAPVRVTKEGAAGIARKYLLAVQEAGRIYRRIVSAKGAGRFVTEVSMDETDRPQTPVEMLFILAAISDEAIPAQTVAPKFTGRFNKGVDYAGDVEAFAGEFEQDLAVIRFAVRSFALEPNLKLSVHSGSDKFSIYEPMRRALAAFDAGLHLKTAGTTWLEELAGLALAGGEALALARQVYVQAFSRYGELCAPYASVIGIDRERLPLPAAVERWTGEQFAAALRHDSGCASYNPHLRQLLHVGYKVAAEMGRRFLDAVEGCEGVIGPNVTGNLLDRHLRKVFPAAERVRGGA